MTDINDFIIKNGVLVKYTGNATDVAIPDGVTEIGSHAFRGCDGLTDIYYGGTRERWAAAMALAQDTGNEALLEAAVRFGTGGDPEPPAAGHGTYLVTIARTGAVHVRADGPEQAMEIADALSADQVLWDDDWAVTDCQASPGYAGPVVTAE